jgi:S1-C subfamily serine protease
VIIEMNGEMIKNMEDLQRQIWRRRVGEEVELTIVRKDKKGLARVTLEEMPKY